MAYKMTEYIQTIWCMLWFFLFRHFSVLTKYNGNEGCVGS